MIQSLALQFVLRDREGGLQESCLLLQVGSLQSRSNRGTRVATSIHDVFPVMVLRVVQESLDAWLCETPCTSIQRLFLAPDNGLCIGVAVEIFF
jgi:hypothetical protein